MSAPNEDPGTSTPAPATPSAGMLQFKQHHPPGQQQQDGDEQQSIDTTRKAKAPSVRRACIACHTGKTRCSEVLPCQSCLKRGLGNSCQYPDPDAPDQHHNQTSQIPPHSVTTFAATPTVYGTPGTSTFSTIPPHVSMAHSSPPNLSQQQYYDYNGQLTGATSSTFRPSKRPRALTEEETAAITRGFTRGDFYVGTSAPVRIDPRLTVRLTLGEGDHVHFAIGETLV